MSDYLPGHYFRCCCELGGDQLVRSAACSYMTLAGRLQHAARTCTRSSTFMFWCVLNLIVAACWRSRGKVPMGPQPQLGPGYMMHA